MRNENQSLVKIHRGNDVDGGCDSLFNYENTSIKLQSFNCLTLPVLTFRKLFAKYQFTVKKIIFSICKKTLDT